MILSTLSTYLLGFIEKTPSRNVFAKTLLNRLSVGCSLSSNETRSDQCLVAAGQRAVPPFGIEEGGSIHPGSGSNIFGLFGQ